MKNTEIEKLIVSYKAHLRKDRLKDELYKWQLLEKFKGRPHLDTSDFATEMKSIDYSNLIFHTGKTVIKQFIDGKPIEYRDCLENLFDDNVPLPDRITKFDLELLLIYRELYENHGHHHDERTAATFLTFNNPDKYTFYKDSYYKKYCDLVGIQSRKKGEKYVHYLELVDDLIGNYIKKDEELIELFQEIIASSDCYKDLNFKILAQDILYQMLDKGQEEQRQETKNLFINMEGIKNYTNLSLNTILYGPPGTGKTYSSIELAYKAIKSDAIFEQNGYEVAKQWFKNELAKNEDRQLDFITFHQNYSYEDFVMGIKPDLNESDGLSFNRHEGIFFKICQRALENLKQSSEEGSVVEPTFNEVFDDFIRPLAEDNTPVTIQMKSNNHSFKLININERNLGFEKQGGGTNHTLTLKTIKDLYEGNREYNIQGLGVYYYPLIERLKALARTKSKQVNAIPLKNYVIIIDEINRANISRVFGELITLIEEDKRWGNEHAMEVRLPDGHTKFTVPKNLYIIGTMNTADKSIALLDIALRRRFEFTALYPDSSKVSPEYKTFFESLNEQVIAKKGIDFTIGHSYFMAKDGEELDFVKIMNKKVIPLLSEYFYNAKDNKIVVDLVEKAIAKAGFAHTIVPSAYQLLIQ